MKSSPLLDEVIPDPDFQSHHSTEIDTPPEVVTRAIEEYRVPSDASMLTHLIFRMRGLRVPAGTLRETLVAAGFTLLVERPGEEFVVGTMGRFWALREQANLVAPSDPAAFRTFDLPRSAVGAMSVRWVRAPGGGTLLSTETRVRATDDAGRRRFRCYWAIIRPFSAAIRRDLLRGIAARAAAMKAVPAAPTVP